MLRAHFRPQCCVRETVIRLLQKVLLSLKQPSLSNPQHLLAAKAVGQGSREPWWGWWRLLFCIMDHDPFEGLGETTPSWRADLVTIFSVPVNEEWRLQPIPKDRDVFLPTFATLPGPRRVARSITELSWRNIIVFKRIQEAWCLRFLMHLPWIL